MMAITKTTKTKTRGVRKAAGRPQESLAKPVTVAQSLIAGRAYALYLDRGREDGHDLDDWLQAERELRAGVSPELKRLG
jgi:hypothetical protein